jgi:magnesium chelatase family protein
LEVPRLSEDERRRLLGKQQKPETGSAELRDAVERCRRVQLQRCGRTNSLLTQNEIQHYCALSEKDSELLNATINRLKISTRAYFRILKIARTIADLAESGQITRAHLLEAINYRRFDTA